METTVEELIDYILGIDEQGSPKPGETRLLLESDRSISLIRYDESVRIFGTNFLGFKIGTFGYVKLNLNLNYNVSNPLKKSTAIYFDIGTILALGIFQF